MYFIIKSEIESVYTLENFNKLINNEDKHWKSLLPTIIEDISSYLRARYDVTSVFAPVYLHDEDTEYETGTRVYTSETDEETEITTITFYNAIEDVPSGTDITDTDFWAVGDTRNKKIVEIVIDMLLYNLLARLNSVDIPAYRKERYDGNSDKQSGGAIGYLRRVAKGEVELDIPLREEGQEDQTGNVVIYGEASEVKDEKFVF
jgi:hypothetical protein